MEELAYSSTNANDIKINPIQKGTDMFIVLRGRNLSWTSREYFNSYKALSSKKE